MQNSLIVRKYAGQAIPDAFIEKVLPIYNGTWGASYLSDDGKIMSAKQDQGMDREKMDELQLHFMDLDMVFFFSQAQREFQPYPVITVDGADRLLVFLEGNFKRKLNDTDTISNEQAIVEKWLAPRLQKIYGFLNGDMEKVRAEVEEDSSLEDFTNMIEDRGNFVLFFPDGAFSIVKGNKAIGSYPWGWASNNLGYTEEMEKEEETEAPAAPQNKLASMFSSGVSAVASAVGLKAPPPPPQKASAPLDKPAAPPPPPAAAKAPPPPPKASVPAAPPPPAPSVEAGKKDVVYYKVKDSKSNNRKKDLYKMAKGNLDFVPDWKNSPVVEIDAETFEKYRKTLLTDGELVDMEKMTEELRARFQKPKPGELKVSSTAADGTTSSEIVKGKAPPPPPMKNTATENIPSLVLPAERRKEIMAQDMAVLDKNSVKIDDPTVLGDLVKKFPPLETQLGKGQFWRAWGPDSLKQWISKNPDAAAIIVFHQNIRLAQLEAAKVARPEEGARKAAGIKK